jgi:hypothetical protein
MSDSTVEAARRCVDIVNQHVLNGLQGKWAAIRLSDGGSDGIPYDTQTQAKNHQLHPTLCCYIRIPLVGMYLREAQVFMQINRDLYDRGYRLGDPDTTTEAMTPNRQEHVRGFHLL